MFDVKKAIEVVEGSRCPWNPLQTPEWHLHQWKASVISDLEKAAAQKEEASA